MILDPNCFGQEYSLYQKYLGLVSSLSNLFSDSDTPYIHYRVMENIFCEAFKANNLSRTDTAFDATKIINGVKYGIGLKTFVANINKSGIAESKREKIAEFNKDSSGFKNLTYKELVLKVAMLRNARIESAKLEYGINKAIYHCIIRYHENDSRKSGRVTIKEFDYEPISIQDIIYTDKNYNPISENKLQDLQSDYLFFKDGKGCYSFNISKSTLFKKFDTTLNNGIIVPVNKAEQPLESLLSRFTIINTTENYNNRKNHVVLPLYSTRGGGSSEKIVPEKSGLNQWNAGGRVRKFGEMYIPVPNFIHNNCVGFFPARSKEFVLITPDNTEMKVSLCQGNGGGKALMSAPNTALSEWFHPLLVKKDNGVITYDDLNRIGKDSVLIEKLSDNKFKFSLAAIGSWENFKREIKERAV